VLPVVPVVVEPTEPPVPFVIARLEVPVPEDPVEASVLVVPVVPVVPVVDPAPPFVVVGFEVPTPDEPVEPSVPVVPVLPVVPVVVEPIEPPFVVARLEAPVPDDPVEASVLVMTVVPVTPVVPDPDPVDAPVPFVLPVVAFEPEPVVPLAPALVSPRLTVDIILFPPHAEFPEDPASDSAIRKCCSSAGSECLAYVPTGSHSRASCLNSLISFW
jgi:hypothetical protein